MVSSAAYKFPYFTCLFIFGWIRESKSAATLKSITQGIRKKVSVSDFGRVLMKNGRVLCRSSALSYNDKYNDTFSCRFWLQFIAAKPLRIRREFFSHCTFTMTIAYVTNCSRVPYTVAYSTTTLKKWLHVKQKSFCKQFSVLGHRGYSLRLRLDSLCRAVLCFTLFHM